MPNIRIVLSRATAVALVVAQASVYALAGYTESRPETAGPFDSLEAAHTAQCVVIHRPDTCITCQFFSVRTATPPAPVAVLAAPDAVAESLPAARAADTGAAAVVLRHSRAPPPSA